MKDEQTGAGRIILENAWDGFLERLGDEGAGDPLLRETMKLVYMSGYVDACKHNARVAAGYGGVIESALRGIGSPPSD